MRWRPWLWFGVSVLCFVSAGYFWRLGDKWAAEKAASQSTNASGTEKSPGPAGPPATHSFLAPIRLLSSPGNVNYFPVETAKTSATNASSPLAYRLNNNPGKSLADFARNEHAILLENALIDTTRGSALPIPEALQAKGDPGSYIVQARGPTDNPFRAAIKAAGASIVAYIPNNAYLVRGSQAAAQQLGSDPNVQTVVPYQPYFKLKPGLLQMAIEQSDLPENAALNLLVFSDAQESTSAQVEQLGAAILLRDRSPFGPVLTVRPPSNILTELAALPGVQAIEPVRQRALANDLSRAAIRSAPDSISPTNYLNLSGTNILVSVSDSGVDTNHPDLLGKVAFDFPVSGIDSNGHGTHVAGIIAGSGARSTTVSNASGSVMPAVPLQFRGQAPGARLLAMNLNVPDSYLQETSARSNAFIANNSWTYRGSDYDLAAASYDAAVRDSLPMRTGPQPLVYVFPTGNEGSANLLGTGAFEGGTGGDADSIQSPGTAKNVITVGAVEQLRSITNVVTPDPTVTNTVTPWFGSTDSSNQITSFSGRGNVGMHLEGDFGRFKPDVVAPGTFVVSTRSGQWDEALYYNSITYDSESFSRLFVSTNSSWVSGLFVPANAIQLIIAITASDSLNPLPVVIIPPGGAPVLGTNFVSMNLSAADPLDDFWTYGVSNYTPQNVVFNLQTILVLTNQTGDFYPVLSNMNSQLGQYYRYESGTSMAAADVSGALALMAEFFQTRLHVTNSPALMKALLVNGARSLGNAYDFHVQNNINYQGWGQVQVPNSLPASITNLVSAPNGPTPMFFFDQNPTNGLATGQSQTRRITVSSSVQDQPLRFTLAWTDPPGNPSASIKLVNDLDLVVTNIDTGEVYVGNDIGSRNDYNLPWETNHPPPFDVVNNVENVYLRLPGGTNFSVTVIGHRVNVNAVSTDPDQVAQDYALVISSGDGLIPDALRMTDFRDVFVTVPNVFFVTNTFPTDPENPMSGGLLLHQHVGANTPLIGTNTLPLTNSANARLTIGVTNQWHFYILSNDFSYTNASFVTFLPPDLSVPRMGVTNVANPDNATRIQADIDLYVSTNPGLTNLDPLVVAAADKSLSRGGTEFVVYSNAAPASVYYIGVKSEDQMAAEYAFLGVFSLFPPTTEDTNGNKYARGMPLPAVIPRGTPPNPQAALVLALDILPVTVRRVVVNPDSANDGLSDIYHTLPGSLLGNLSHAEKFAVLNNHTCSINPATGNCFTNWDYIYEDNGEGNVVGSRHSDGPGDLKQFMGEEGLGVWLLTMVNDFPAGTGAVNRVVIKLEPQNLNSNGVVRDVLPSTITYDSIEVPADATNLLVCVSGNTAPMDLYVQRGAPPSAANFDYHLTVPQPGGCLSISIYDNPPLTAGRYYIGVFNPSPTTQHIRITAQVFRNPYAVASTISSFTGPVQIADDAVTYAYITNLVHMTISAVDVGLLINHPRISDLAITLISPNGTRVLLFEDRGAGVTNGLGTFSSATNSTGMPVYAITNMTAFYTNNFDDVDTGFYAPGAVFDGWNVLSNYALIYPELPAPWLSNNVLILGNGVVSNTLPTTNSTSYSLSYQVSHAPYLVGTVAWWPLDGDGTDIFGGFDGLLLGDVLTRPGMVNRAFFGDGIGTRMVVPRCADLDVGRRPGFSIEGWIRPENIGGSQVVTGAMVWQDGFESTVPRLGVPTGTTISGWLVESGDVDVVGYFYNLIPDTGQMAVDLSGFNAGSISRSFATTPGRQYLLNFAYSKNPLYDDSFVARATVALTGQPAWTLVYGDHNSQFTPNWYHTSVVFTASAAVTKLQLTSLNPGNGGMFVDTFSVQDVQTSFVAAPIAEWYDVGSTNPHPQGVQFWLSGLPGTNAPGALFANLWDTNGFPHILASITNSITNGAWQHVALTFDARTEVARLYRNGQLASFASVSLTNFLPFTAGDFFLGYHPAPGTAFAAFQGGLDEFGLYARPLTDCEIQAIAGSGPGGKYGTNVIWCPVTSSVGLITSLGNLNFTFTNGLTWRTNGIQWETNTIEFNNTLQYAYTNGPATNVASILLTNIDQNAALDEFVLSSLQTNYIGGLLHFTENTNLALVPIKFGPWPYMESNFPPTLIFSNDFEFATQRVYQAGETLRGSSNNPAFGPRDWTVINGPVTVISNRLVDAEGSNFVALANGTIASALPTIPGHRYTITYSVRGPGAVSWWSGDVEPLSQRAWDVLGGNNGAFIQNATNSNNGFVSDLGDFNALFLPGFVDPTNGYSSKVDLGDPANLKLTNAFTIEGWIQPLTRTNLGVEQILFRGDSRDCLDPYYLALSRVTPTDFDILFHIENGDARDCGITLATVHHPVHVGQWQHIAAVFESNIVVTNAPGRTNQLRIYLNGQRLFPQNQDVALQDPTSNTPWNDLTPRFPIADLDPSFNPGVSIGNRSRYDYSQPFRGLIDELSVYGRALTDAEIAAIAGRGTFGKADFRAAPQFALAKVNAFLNNVLIDTANGDNTRWTTRTFTFTADRTNLVFMLQSLLPGTIVDGITLTETPSELDYLPEQSLNAINGEDAYGVWRLEIWDTRAGALLTNGLPELLQWQLNFVLQPSSPQPVIHLEHGLPYTNFLAAHTVQHFVVDVPQWAQFVTNSLLFVADRSMTNPQVAGVLYDLTNAFPSSITNGLFWPPVSFATTNFTTNTTTPPFMVPGQSYFLTVTNPNPFSISFAYGVWFDITTITNCQLQSNFVWQAGIPRYFQFDVPTNTVAPGDSPVEAVFYLTGAGTNSVGWRSNLTVVLSQHLPLPDLTHYDYISRQPSTNDAIVMVLTNSTPFPTQTNRWYAGVFSSADTNIAFTVQACYATTNSPFIISLTNGIPFATDITNRFVAPPGPPRWFFFEFEVTNYVDGLLFELYNLSGDADLVVQREIVPGIAPYFDGSFQTGRSAEQVVVRVSFEVPDLRGKWYLGIYNNETTNVTYTIRAVTRQGGLLLSGQGRPQSRLSPMPPSHGLLLQWNSIIGEWYEIDFSPTLFPPQWQVLTNGLIRATTPLTTFEVPVPVGGSGFYRVQQVSAYSLPAAPLTIQLWTNNLIRISWSTNFPNQTLQASDSPAGPWVNVNRPVFVEGNVFVVYDPVGTLPRYYRLIP